MNSYLRLFLIAGIPIIVVLTIFFSLLLGFSEGLIPGLSIGLLVGSFISLILGFFYSKSTKDLLYDWRKDIQSRPNRQKNLILIFLPYFILLLGAIFTRISGQILPALALTIILSMAVYALYSYFLGEFKRSLQEGELITYVVGIITLIIPFTIAYFVFLLVICGFDFNRIKSLF